MRPLTATVLMVMALTFFGATTTAASPIVILIDFESFSELDAVGAVDGVTFNSPLVLTAGSTLNEFDFPPVSGSNVLSDILLDPGTGTTVGGPIVLEFSTPVSNVGGWFTYTTLLTLSAFNGSSTLVAQTNSSATSNLGFSEFLSLSATGIRRVVIEGSPDGASFTLDDLEFVIAESVPEPGALALVALGAIGLFARCTRRRRINLGGPDVQRL